MTQPPGSVAQLVGSAMGGASGWAAARWGACGGMALTGRPDGPADVRPARVALAMDALAADLARVSALVGEPVQVDGAALLGERAAIAGHGRRGDVSCGGATRLLRTADGAHLTLALARDDDWELLPALLGEAIEVDDWAHVAGLVGQTGAPALIEQAALLGVPCALLGEVTAERPLVAGELVAGRPRSMGELTVVDLSSLWAGPLCAQLLGLAGARVIKVESTRRPDGARSGPPAFFDLLHAGHESVAVDFGTAEGRQALAALLQQADIVIEASRPRALEGLGVAYEHMRRLGWSGVWLSITGYGRTGFAAQRVAFGDDAAVAGGLVAGDIRTPTFCADAAADPATGLLGAAVVLRAIERGDTGLLGVSLAGTAAHLAAGIAANASVADEVEAAPPTARPARGRAASMGADTARVLATACAP